MEKKTTKRQHINTLLGLDQVKANEELVDYLTHELELLDKKNASRKGEKTERQIENDKYMEDILSYMAEVDSSVSISTIAKHYGLTSQRVTPLMAKLEKANKVVKTVEKRTSLYTLA